jgi:hypothetical protein
MKNQRYVSFRISNTICKSSRGFLLILLNSGRCISYTFLVPSNDSYWRDMTSQGIIMKCELKNHLEHIKLFIKDGMKNWKI